MSIYLPTPAPTIPGPVTGPSYRRYAVAGQAWQIYPGGYTVAAVTNKDATARVWIGDGVTAAVGTSKLLPPGDTYVTYTGNALSAITESGYSMLMVNADQSLVADIPSTTPFVALNYGSGDIGPTSPDFSLFPNARHWATTSSGTSTYYDNADAIDLESGGLTNESKPIDAPTIVNNLIALGKTPVMYCSTVDQPTVTITGVTATHNSATLSRALGFAGVTKGMAITLTGVVTGTIVTAVGATTVTMSANFTGTTGTVSVGFCNFGLPTLETVFTAAGMTLPVTGLYLWLADYDQSRTDPWGGDPNFLAKNPSFVALGAAACQYQNQGVRIRQRVVGAAVTSGTTYTSSFSACSAGSLLLLKVYVANASTDPNIVTPSGGWAFVGKAEAASAVHGWVYMFHKLVADGNETSAVLNWTGATTNALAIFEEWPGWTGPPILDLEGAGNVGSATTTSISPTGGDGTPFGGGATAELVVSTIGFNNTVTVPAATWGVSPSMTVTSGPAGAIVLAGASLVPASDQSGSSLNEVEWTWTTARFSGVVLATYYDSGNLSDVDNYQWNTAICSELTVVSH